jgi:hypothetical protein
MFIWNIVNDETKKIVFTIKDSALVTHNCYTPNFISPRKIATIEIDGNTVVETFKDGTAYLYDLDGDMMVGKRLKVPVGWTSLIYRFGAKPDKVYSFVFKDGFYADLAEKNLIYILEPGYNTFVAEIENKDGIFERYGLEKLYYMQFPEQRGYYCVAKYVSSETEICYNGSIYSNDSIDEIIKCIEAKQATRENIFKTAEQMRNMIATGSAKTEKHQGAMVKAMHEHFMSLSCTNKSITYSPTNAYAIAQITVTKVSKFNVTYILTFTYTDSQVESYLALSSHRESYVALSSRRERDIYVKYNLDIKDLIEANDRYDQLFERDVTALDLSKVINVESFVNTTHSDETKRRRAM